MSARAAHWVSGSTAIVGALSPGSRIAVGMCEPHALTTVLAENASRLSGLSVVAWPLLGERRYELPEYNVTHLKCAGLPSARTYIPTRTSDAHRLFLHGHLPVDAVFIHVAPPDPEGWCSFGVVADYTYDIATEMTDVVVIAEVNDQLPSVPGTARIHIGQVDFLVRSSNPIPETPTQQADAAERAIAAQVASLLPDGATLQMGVGRIPVAVAGMLTTARDLGIHSGIIGDTVVDLVERGVVSKHRKPNGDEPIVTGSILGTRRLLDWCDANPLVSLRPFSETNSLRALCQHEALVSLNSALQVDLSGQVNAESLGGSHYGSVGGQPDFQEAAAWSPRGLGIVALKSRTSRGVSTVVASLASGDPISTLRSESDAVVTEHGVARLRARDLATRARNLIAVADPGSRAQLAETAAGLGLL